MAKKSKDRETAHEVASSAPSGKNGGSAVRWAAIGMMVLGGAFFLYAMLSLRPAASSTTVANDRGPEPVASAKDRGQTKKFRYFENPAEAHPLPVTLPPSHFQNQGIAGTYKIAKEIPEVLAQQPCLCGCDNTSDDHRSLLDCYIDEHASTCLVCMKEAVLAKQMTEAGKSASDVRDAILKHDFSEVSIGN